MDIHLSNDYDFYIKPGYTNMRKHARSLALMVESEMSLNPFSKAVFVFCGGRGKIIRAIVWDRNGWFEISKKLECQMSFRWPQNSRTSRRRLRTSFSSLPEDFQTRRRNTLRNNRNS